jgi:MarR family transcriptional regulator, organic hydroperoxide resistance regulator
MAAYGRFDLTDFLPYLVNRLGVALVERFAAALRPHDLSIQAWRVMAALDHRDGQRVSDLAATTSIDVSTLSRLVGVLQRQGLVERRRPAGGDARIVTVHATARCRRLVAELLPEARRLEAAALAGLAPADVAALKALLVRAYGNLVAADAPRSEAA